MRIPFSRNGIVRRTSTNARPDSNVKTTSRLLQTAFRSMRSNIPRASKISLCTPLYRQKILSSRLPSGSVSSDLWTILSASVSRKWSKWSPHFSALGASSTLVAMPRRSAPGRMGSSLRSSSASFTKGISKAILLPVRFPFPTFFNFASGTFGRHLSPRKICRGGASPSDRFFARRSIFGSHVRPYSPGVFSMTNFVTKR